MHGIMENDNLFVVGDRAWHGLGTALENPVNSEDAMRIANLGWRVVQEPVMTESGILIDNLYANLREDTKGILGTVTGKYRICQNTEAFDFVDSLIDEKEGAKYDTAGSLFNGKKVWLLVKLPERKFMGDNIEDYLCFSNSHDGKSSIKCAVTSVRVVCNNTLQLALQEAKRLWAVRHMGTLEGRIDEARATLGLADKYITAFEKVAEKFALQKLSNADVFLNALVEDKEEDSERIKKNNAFVRDSIMNLYQNKPDLQNWKGSVWGMFQAVADYASNADPLRNAPTFKENRMNQFITFMPMLDKAQKILQIA